MIMILLTIVLILLFASGLVTAYIGFVGTSSPSRAKIMFVTSTIIWIVFIMSYLLYADIRDGDVIVSFY